MTGPDRRLRLPSALVVAAEREGRTGWLATLPATVARLAEAWSLRVQAPFQPGGQTAWVAPVADRSGAELVLKLTWRHPEAMHEADGLAVWAGNGTVRLHAVEHFTETTALLLERCRPGTPLTAPEPEQDVIVAGLLRRLWSAPADDEGRFRPLKQICDAWAEEFTARLAAEPRLMTPAWRVTASRCSGCCRTAPTGRRCWPPTCTPGSAGRRAGAVAGHRPQAPRGDPTYDALQHLLNCEHRLHADPAGLAARMADLLGLEALRLRRWLFARCVQESPDWPPLADVARRLRIDRPPPAVQAARCCRRARTAAGSTPMW
jgi:streptomycin 6-kinase